MTDSNRYCGFLVELDCGRLTSLYSTGEEIDIFPSPWSVGIGMTYQTSPFVELGGLISYHRLKYEINGDIDNTPTITTSSQSDGYGKIFETSVNVHLYFFDSNIIQLVFFQGGHYWITYPKVTYYDVDNKKADTTGIYYKNGSSQTAWIIGTGLGAKIHINRCISVKAELLLIGALQDGKYIGLNFAVQYRL